MNVTVKKSALEELVMRLVENRTKAVSENIEIDEKIQTDDEPIVPSPQMSMQLSVDQPPVGDPEYVPASPEELSRAASVISTEVPDDQVDFYYRQLHRLLDAALDKHEEAIGKAINENEEDAFRLNIRTLLEQLDDADDEEDNFEYEDEDYDTDLDKTLSIEDKVENTLDRIQDYLHSSDVFEKLINDIVDQPIAHQGETYKFPVRFAKMIEEAPNITAELFSKDAVKKIMADLNFKEKKEVVYRMQEYIKTFLKDPSRYNEDEEEVSKANKKAEELYKKAEKDLEVFKKLLDDEVDKNRKKSPVFSTLLAIVGYKAIQNIEAGEEVPDDFGDIGDDEREFEDELSPGEEEEINDELEKQSDSDTWTQIAREEGFASAAGARQYAYKPMIKMFLQTEVLDESTMEIIVSLAARAFRRHLQELSSKNKLSPEDARGLMASAKIGPGQTGNDLFRIFFSNLFYQPYVNDVLKLWRAQTENFFENVGVERDILDKHAVSLVRMATGETKPNQEKIKKLISMEQFRKVRAQTRKWIEDRPRMNNDAKSFAKSRMTNKSKVASAFKKAFNEVRGK